MLHITYDMALEALKAAVEEKGEDFVYEKPDDAATCAYLHVDENGDMTVPGCGVGNALLRLGVSAKFLEDYNEGYGVGHLVRDADGRSQFTIDKKALALFFQFQTVQDNKGSWSLALSLATSYVRDYHN